MASRSLGSLTIDLIAKTFGFEQGMDRAARSSEKNMKRIEAQAKKLGRDIGLALVGIGGIVSAGLAKYIKNTIDFQNEQAQLAARLKSTGSVAGQTMASLDDLANEMRRTTAVTGDQISKAQDLLLTFTNVRGVIYELAIPAILDMAVAMRQDAGSAAILLGKALNDPIKGIAALGRAGVQFSEDQRELIKSLAETGEVAKAQELILKELETQFGGSAAAARNTLGGALINLRESFDELLEGRGGGLNGTVVKINELADSLSDPSLKRGIDDLVGGLLSAANAAVEAAAKIGQFIGSYREFIANQGFLPANEERTLKQLEQRRANLQSILGEAGNGGGGGRDGAQGQSNALSRWFADVTGASEELRAELAETDKLIRGFPFRDVQSRVLLDVKAPAATGGGSSGGKKKGGKSDAQREAEEAIKAAQKAREELERQVQAVVDAREEFDGYAAQLAGPMAAANYQFAIEQERLNELAREGEISTERLAEAQANLRKEHEANVEAIRKQLDPVGELIKEYEFENELMRMGNDERELAIALRYADAAATDEQLAKLREQIRANRELAESIELQDGMRDSFAGFFEDVIGGTKSVGDAFRDMLDDINRMILQRISENWVEQLFGASGSSGGGSAGGWLELFAGLFSGGKASGGWASPNSLYEVNERGMEMASVNGRDYLLTGNKPVEITPNNRLQSAGGGVTQNFYSPRFDTKQTPAQLAQEARIAQQLAMRNA